MRRPGVGPARRAGFRGIGGGAPPVNTVAPVASGTVTIGGTLSVTTGTWTGTAPTYTYQWQRGATIDGVGSYSNIGSATASTYTPVAADMGYSLRCIVTATNGAGAVAANSNALRYYPGQVFRCVYDPKSAGGFVDDVGTAAANDLTATGTPTHNATDAGFNNEPTETLSGSGQYWTKTSASMGGAISTLQLWLVVRIDTYAANDIFAQYTGTGGDYRIRMTTGPVVQVTGTGTGATASVATTAIANAKLLGGVITLNGSQSVYYKTTAEDTDTNTHGGLADSGTISIGASSAGASDAAITIGLALVANAASTAGQRADLGAYCTNRFGAGVGS